MTPNGRALERMVDHVPTTPPVESGKTGDATKHRAQVRLLTVASSRPGSRGRGDGPPRRRVGFSRRSADARWFRSASKTRAIFDPDLDRLDVTLGCVFGLSPKLVPTSRSRSGGELARVTGSLHGVTSSVVGARLASIGTTKGSLVTPYRSAQRRQLTDRRHPGRDDSRNLVLYGDVPAADGRPGDDALK